MGKISRFLHICFTCSTRPYMTLVNHLSKTPNMKTSPFLPPLMIHQEVAEEEEEAGAGAEAEIEAANINATTTIPEEGDNPQLANENLPVGGRLAHFKNRWTFSPWAHSIISKGLGWTWLGRPPPRKLFFQEATPFLKTYVKDLLAKAVIKKAKSIKFQGRLFCVPKKNSDKKRVILDLSNLNKFIKCERFRMLTISQIRTLLPREAVPTFIDLTEAYWHILITRRLIPYLGFKLESGLCIQDPSNGLNIAPRAFTKLADTVVQHLTKGGPW